MCRTNQEPSLAQSEASRANSQLSTGPRTAAGKARSNRNLNSPKPREFSAVIARSLKALGERRGDFENLHRGLTEAMQPRDGWEAAWVQDIAMLRWRLERLQRAEMGRLAVHKRKLAGDRLRAKMPPSGLADLRLRTQIGLVGINGIEDSPWKFRQVITHFEELRDIIRGGYFDEDNKVYFRMLYGDQAGAQGVLLQSQFATVAKLHAEGKFESGGEAHVELLRLVNEAISDYQQKLALFEAENAQADPIRQDAESLLPASDLEGIIRYETHLEDQIERKLRQFYARRREATLFPKEAPARDVKATGPAELARAEGAA